MPSALDRLINLASSAGAWDAVNGLLDRPERYHAGAARAAYAQGYEANKPFEVHTVDLQRPLSTESLSFRVRGRTRFWVTVEAEVAVRGDRWSATYVVGLDEQYWPHAARYAALWARRLWRSQPRDFRNLLPAVLASHELARPLTWGSNPILGTPEGAQFRDYLEETDHPLLDYYENAWAWHAVWPLFPTSLPPVGAECRPAASAVVNTRHWVRPTPCGMGWEAVCGVGYSSVLFDGAGSPVDVPHFHPCPDCYRSRPIPYLPEHVLKGART